ncbi:MAG: HalOD1 output domain-containing protein [Halorientalis sp.]
MTTAHFDPGKRDMPNVAVVRAVAAQRDVPIDDLDCTLQDVIDTKGLNRLFSPTADGTPRAHGDAFVRFQFCRCEVTVHDDGTVLVGDTDYRS